MKKKIFQLTLLILIVLIIANPTTAVNSAKEGAYLWFNTLLPSLLPFLILSELFILSGFVDFFSNLLGGLMRPIFNVPGSGAFPLLVSSISGYPIGSKITSDLRHNKYINRIEANRLITFTSTSGPLFILGSILTGMLNMPESGVLMILPHYLGIITVGCLFRFYGRSSIIVNSQNKTNKNIRPKEIHQTNKSMPIGTLISQSIKESMDAIILIGGFVILYNVIIEILIMSKLMLKIISIISYFTKIDIDIIQAYIAGIIELTTGCKKISSLNIDPLHKIMLLNSLIAWGGFSILSQAISFISQTDISIKLFILSKFLHSIFAVIYTYILSIFGFKKIAIESSKILILERSFNIANWINRLRKSSQLSLGITISFIILSFLSHQLFSERK